MSPWSQYLTYSTRMETVGFRRNDASVCESSSGVAWRRCRYMSHRPWSLWLKHWEQNQFKSCTFETGHLLKAHRWVCFRSCKFCSVLYIPTAPRRPTPSQIYPALTHPVTTDCVLLQNIMTTTVIPCIEKHSVCLKYKANKIILIV